MIITLNHTVLFPVVQDKKLRYPFDHRNPFYDEDEVDEIAPVGYRYRCWDLGNNIKLVARTEHDAVLQTPSGETNFINIKASSGRWDQQYLLAFCRDTTPMSPSRRKI